MATDNPEEKQPRSSDDPELVEVFEGADPVQLQVVRDMLEQAGIEISVFDKMSARMLGTTLGVPERVMVHKDDEQEAIARLKDLGLVP